jgi:hypothetical protein
MVTAPDDNRNFFILRLLLDDAVEELVMCAQKKISKHVFSVCALKPLIDEAAEELVMCPQMKISKPVSQYVPSSHCSQKQGTLRCMSLETARHWNLAHSCS